VRSPRLFAAIGLIGLGAVLVSMPAYAQQQQYQDPMRAKGDKACSGDARKICSKFFGQGDMAMLSCFQQNATRLSQSCRSFLVEVGQLQR
jgi:hypothetical protein